VQGESGKPSRKRQVKVIYGVPGRLSTKLISVILLPKESLEDAFFKKRKRLARYPHKVIAEREGFAMLWVVN